MLTIEALRAWGADTDDGLRRCMNNEAFYLRLVEKSARDGTCDRLKEAVEAGDREKAFELAHALKGMYANLALTPLSAPLSEITELLRARTQTDYAPLIGEITAQKKKLDALAAG